MKVIVKACFKNVNAACKKYNINFIDLLSEVIDDKTFITSMLLSILKSRINKYNVNRKEKNERIVKIFK